MVHMVPTLSYIGPCQIRTHNQGDHDFQSLVVVSYIPSFVVLEFENPFRRPIYKVTFHIHLLVFEFHVRCKCNLHPDGSNSSYWCKDFIIIDPLFLIIALNYKTGFISCDNSIIIKFFLNTYFVFMIVQSGGLGTKFHILLWSN